MNEKETLSCITLTKLSYFSLGGLHELYQRVGSATAIMEHRNDIRDVLPDASDRLTLAFRDITEAKHRAEAEYEWAISNGIQPIAIGDSQYPQRLNECPDAPLVLYYKGCADLNKQKIISIVGTRQCTVYGQDLIRRFTQDLKEICPDVLIISGLAYGVDINAHREALKNGLPTVAVLAHGLDQIYPNAHRQTAIEMLHQGGLITEYPSQTPGAKGNFVQRNRLVAGMADAAILVESKAKGGGLITMGIARDYNRDTFAFPGPIGAKCSEGCNNLIRDNGAALITSAEDLVKAMCWMDDTEIKKARKNGIERQLFPNLTAEEQLVVKVLQDTNNLQINIITVKTGIPINRITSLLFSLEMKGVIKTMAGGCYHLL